MREGSTIRALGAVVVAVACLSLPVGTEAQAEDDPAAAARNAAVAALAKIAEKSRGPADAEFVRYVARVSMAAAGPDPALRTSVQTRFDALRAQTAVPRDDVIERLRAAVRKADRGAKPGVAFAGARALRGLGVQRRRIAGASLPDPLENEALAVVERLRAERWATAKPMTVDELRAIPEPERRRFEEAHASWESPTLAVTPGGTYRIESVCGPRTTLLLARDLDAVHRRLARFCGKDPFEGKPGLLRVVGGVADMEGEGQSLLWARAFNAGTVTTTPVHLTTRRWLVRGLSHELLHRFDAELFGFLPGWLREGRANWAQTTTSLPDADRLDERLTDFAMLERAHRAGYADPARLASLLDGRPASPQDDYDTGYALWLYLSRFGEARFGARIGAYLAAHRAQASKGPRTFFVEAFCDGKDQRPASLEALAADFAAFLAAAAGPETGWKKEWAASHREAEREAQAARAAPRPAGAREFDWPGDEDIFDASNAAPDRTRTAVPALGERHAFAAARFFERTGDAAGAALADAWSREVDEPSRQELSQMAAAAAASKNAVAAWLLRAEAWRLGGPPPGDPPSALAPVAAAVSKLTAADRRRIDDALVRPSVAVAARADEASPPAERAASLGLATGTWSPAYATGGAFSLRGGTDLVLGAAEGARADGPLGDDAAPRLVFVETAHPSGSSYRLRAVFRPSSVGADAAVVLGKTGPDRGLAVQIRPVATPGSRSFGSVSIAFDDGRGADWGAATPQTTVDLTSAATSVEVQIDVAGAYAVVSLGGRPAGSFRTATGIPLDGRVGFLLRSGAVEFRDLTLVRGGAAASAADPIDPASPGEPGAWNGRRVKGVDPDPAGRVVVLVRGDAERKVDADAPALLGISDVRVMVIPTAGAASGPVWLALDADGIVRSHGAWRADDPELHRARTLLRRLRGW